MRITVEAQFPQGIEESRDGRAVFQEAMLGSLQYPFENMTQQVRAKSRSERVAEGYFIEPLVLGDTVQMGLRNDDPLQPILEHGTRPHFIPAHFVPIGALVGWSSQHGMNPYAVRAKIAREGFQHPGTQGDHVVENAMQDFRAEFDQAVQRGAYAFVLGMIGMAR